MTFQRHLRFLWNSSNELPLPVPYTEPHGILPWACKVAPLGLGTLFQDPVREPKGHIRSLRGTSLGVRETLNPKP